MAVRSFGRGAMRTNRLGTSDDEAVRFSAKRELEWVGYKTHLSETCEPDELHLITQVTTTLATQATWTRWMPSLQTWRKRIAHRTFIGCGVDAEALISAQQTLGVTLLSPIREKVSWSKQGQGFPWQMQCTRAKSGARHVNFPNTPPYSRPAWNRSPRNSKPSTHTAPASKGPFRKRCEGLICAQPATSGWLKPTSKCSPPRPPLPCPVGSIGGKKNRARKREFHPSPN